MKKPKFQVIGYCPGCKEPIWYDWDNDTGRSDCSCYRHTHWREILEKVQEEKE